MAKQINIQTKERCPGQLCTKNVWNFRKRYDAIEILSYLKWSSFIYLCIITSVLYFIVYGTDCLWVQISFRFLLSFYFVWLFNFNFFVTLWDGQVSVSGMQRCALFALTCRGNKRLFLKKYWDLVLALSCKVFIQFFIY